MLPTTTSSTTSPAVRTTKMSPKVTSKTSSGGTRESEQLTITANGFWSFARAWRRSINAAPCGSSDFPATNRLSPFNNRLSASSAPTPADSPAMLLAAKASQQDVSIRTAFLFRVFILFLAKLTLSLRISLSTASPVFQLANLRLVRDRRRFCRERIDLLRAKHFFVLFDGIGWFSFTLKQKSRPLYQHRCIQGGDDLDEGIGLKSYLRSNPPVG